MLCSLSSSTAVLIPPWLFTAQTSANAAAVHHTRACCRSVAIHVPGIPLQPCRCSVASPCWPLLPATTGACCCHPSGPAAAGRFSPCLLPCGNALKPLPWHSGLGFSFQAAWLLEKQEKKQSEGKLLSGQIVTPSAGLTGSSSVGLVFPLPALPRGNRLGSGVRSDEREGRSMDLFLVQGLDFFFITFLLKTCQEIQVLSHC